MFIILGNFSDNDVLPLNAECHVKRTLFIKKAFIIDQKIQNDHFGLVIMVSSHR